MTSSLPRRPRTIASNNTSAPVRGETRLQIFLWWVPAVIWAGVIFYMSTRTFGAAFSSNLLRDILAILHLGVSPHTSDVLDVVFRKLGHLTEYAIFSMFLYHALGNANRSAWNLRKALACILIAGLYSLTDEFHQRFVPGRGPSIVDCGIDTIGATLGMLIVYIAGRGRLKSDSQLREGTPGDEKPVAT